ncbi:MAG: MMPL family transporter [Desulfuromonadales bacterium]|nr:MMPL family transporter [Desulfuromonadales bacterium]
MGETANNLWYKLVEAQLRYRVVIVTFLAIGTIFFTWNIATKLKVATDFFELYPPNHEYIQLYKEYRKMFGSANVLTIIVERTDESDIYNPQTLEKLDQLTTGVLAIPGVNPLQVASATHPKVKQVINTALGIGVFPLTWPSDGYPKNEEESELFRKTVYSQTGIRGFFVSLDDKSTALYAGFWEEGLDFGLLYKEMNKLKAAVEDDKHTVYVSGYPMLYAWLDHYKLQLSLVLLATLTAMVAVLVGYFRSFRGVMLPVFSGVISALWGIGFACAMGWSLDPLLLVVPILLSARALSHSCQCMERFHQEYSVVGDNRKAIVSAYGKLYPPAMLAIVTDGLGCMTIAIASIPLMQKLGYISAFWIVTIFIGVVILNPIALSYMKPPKLKNDISPSPYTVGKEAWWLRRLAARGYELLIDFLHAASGPRMKWVVGAFVLLMAVGGGIFTSLHLKIGDSSAGKAILYDDHPYNIAADRMNKDYAGAAPLVVIIKGKESGAIKDQNTLKTMDDLGMFMENNISNVGGTLSLTDLVRRINRMYHDGSPKWETIPENPQVLGQIFFTLAASMAPGEMDQLVSLPDYTHSNVTAYFRDYDHASIKSAIATVKEFGAQVEADADSKIEVKLAGGLLGILAAVNEEVEWSYWAILSAIFTSTFILCFITYRSWKAAIILCLPLYVSQVMCDLVMMVYNIDLNINTLPVASIGVGVGIDYGIYLLSRLKEECANTNSWERARLMALTTTGRIILFTGVTLVFGLFFWLFSDIKFQAEMGFLILLLMIFNMIGALVFIPALTGILKPQFVKDMAKRNVDTEVLGAVRTKPVVDFS